MKKKKAQASIEALEKKVNEGDKDAQSSLRAQKSILAQLEDWEIEETEIYFREWWAGKAYRLTKQMFQMLKAKQVANYLPLLKYQNGLEASSDDENKIWIHNHFKKLFQEPDEISKEQDPYIERIKQVRKKVIPTDQAKTLERPLTK